jgi:hypothetical protein
MSVPLSSRTYYTPTTALLVTLYLSIDDSLFIVNLLSAYSHNQDCFSYLRGGCAVFSLAVTVSSRSLAFTPFYSFEVTGCVLFLD